MSWVESTSLTLVQQIVSKVFTFRPDDGHGQAIVDRITLEVPEYLIGGILGRAYVNYKEQLFRIKIHLEDKNVWLYYDHHNQKWVVKDCKKGEERNPLDGTNFQINFRF